ncbi:MAG: hypothetical protein II937_03440 [Bacteroidales bacterium]|nr:hypothetical protein [Bacteroidales bacterium]
MKTKFFMTVLCFAVLFSACMENGSQKSNAKSNTTTTTTTDTDNGKSDGNKSKTDSKTEVKNTFQSANGKFSINFPEPPQGPEMQIEKNKAGLMQTFTYTLPVSDKGSYFAYYKDYPVGVITDSNTDQKLKGEAESFMKSLGCAISKTTEERLDGNKGLSFSGTLNDTISVNMRAFFVGKRYYQFGTISAGDAISDKESKKFISSFEIVK